MKICSLTSDDFVCDLVSPQKKMALGMVFFNHIGLHCGVDADHDDHNPRHSMYGIFYLHFP